MTFPVSNWSEMTAVFGFSRTVGYCPEHRACFWLFSGAAVHFQSRGICRYSCFQMYRTDLWVSLESRGNKIKKAATYRSDLKTRARPASNFSLLLQINELRVQEKNRKKRKVPQGKSFLFHFYCYPLRTSQIVVALRAIKPQFLVALGSF